MANSAIALDPLVKRSLEENKPSPVLMKNYELSTDSNLLEYIGELQKAEYVCKFIGSKTDFILGKPHLLLSASLPESALSRQRFSKKVFHQHWSSKIHYESAKLDSFIRSIVSTNEKFYLKMSEYIIHENINKDLDLFLQNDHVFIENIFTYINQILVDIAIRQCYGESAKNDSKFLSLIMLLLGQRFFFGEKYLNELLRFRLFSIRQESDIAREYLKGFVTKGTFKKLIEGSKDENHCFVNLILKNQKELDIPDDIFYTSLPDYLYLFVTLIGVKLSNFLVDVSLNPLVCEKLEIEQKSIIAHYGKEITMRHLDKMVYLDAAITESLRLSNNKMPMKEALCDIYLPNGVFVPRSSFCGYSNLARSRSSKLFLDDPHDFIPERHLKLGTKLD
ncbi:hypothetical protein BB560_006858, partial [Smittium megazygosporum]